MLGGLEAKLSAEEVGWFIIVLFIGLFGTLILAGVVKTILRFSKGKDYGIFLCHSKATSGLFARQVKMMFELLTPRKAFLDVDELENLDNLNFTVRANTDNFLIMVTKETFSRFWCALEIVSAAMNNIRTVVVSTIPDDQDVLAEDFLKGVQSMWGALERAELDKLGITLGDVEDGYRKVATLPRAKVLYNDTFENQYNQVKTVLSQVARCPSGQKEVPPDPLHTAYVVFDTKSIVQTTVARVMFLLLKGARWTTQLCDDTIPSLKKPSVKGASATGVVLISADMIRNPLCVAVVALMWETEVPVVTVLSQEDFPNITPSSFTELKKNSPMSQKVGTVIQKIGEGTTITNIIPPTKALFKILAWRFNPQDSYMVLKMEFERIVERLRMAKKPDKAAAQQVDGDAEGEGAPAPAIEESPPPAVEPPKEAEKGGWKQDPSWIEDEI
jgi:hypothetical protein